MKTTLLLLALTLLSEINIYSQAQLVQSFIEQNIMGDTQFGYSVSGAGDVNNDGYADVIVGAYNYNSGTGRAYIYFGGNSMDSTADVTMTGEGQINSFGHSVSGAGDVNNDGYDDVIVGAYNYNSGAGRAYMYYGGSSMDATADVTMNAPDGSYFGYSVSGAGDVNNDGYDDVIVGAYYYNYNAGRAYMYYGGSSMDATADVTMNGPDGSYFGYSVSGAGDVNNDGYDDVIVGAYAYRFYSSTGRAYIFYGGDSINTTFAVTLNGEATENYFGASVSGAGDVNNDGYDDVIVGAYGFSSSTGRTYIFYGGSSMDATSDVTMTGEGTNNYFGYSVSDAGDVNNDGYADVIVGAIAYPSYSFIGRAYIYYGGSSMDDTADVTMTGEQSNNSFGSSVSLAGDVNNDGYDDVIAGAKSYNSYTGRAYIYYGGNSMDATVDVGLNGEGTTNLFGSSVSDAGDVNNDGYTDAIVGAYYYNSRTGRVYIYYGGNSMDATVDVTITGEGTNNYFGQSVSAAGDVNNDGYADIIVGAYGYNSSTGRAYLYYGGSSMDDTADVTMTGEGTYNYFGQSVSGTGDVNNDGFDDVIVGAYSYNSATGRAYIYFGGGSMDASADITLNGLDIGSYFGYAVSSAGDINNDGYDDIIVGAYGYPSYSNTGRAYLYYGGSSMDTTADVTLAGEGTNNYFGSSVSGVGDVNNDGYADIVVGAYYYNSRTGRTYLYYGGSSMDSTADVTMTGEGTNNYFGYSLSGSGDVNNDGYADIIVGAYGYNSFTGRAYIYYGGSSMDDTADVTITGEGTNNYFGQSVSAAGDVNNDGYSDFIVGATSFPNNGKAYIYSHSNAPLPVELTRFTAYVDKRKVALNWETATETNNYGFEIERKQKDQEWEMIGFVQGYGNSNSPKSYSFLDDDVLSGHLEYRLKQIDVDEKIEYSEVIEVTVGISGKFGLSKNYPNPFNPSTKIEYHLPENGFVTLKVYNILGKEVATLVNKEQNAGNYRVTFDASSLASGIYLYTIQYGEFADTKKMLFIK